MFSQTTEYALRAIVWLAQQEFADAIGNKKIAEGTLVPETYLAKILQQLNKAGLVNSRRGVGGGFALAYEPEEITVLDVINAVDPLDRFDACPLNLKSHAKRRCRMHASLDDAMESVEAVFSQTSIAEIVADNTRPTPMKN